MKKVYEFLKFTENLFAIAAFVLVLGITMISIQSLNPQFTSTGSVAGINSEFSSLKVTNLLNQPNAEITEEINEMDYKIQQKSLQQDSSIQEIISFQNPEEFPQEVELSSYVRGNVLSALNIYLTSPEDTILIHTEDFVSKNQKIQIPPKSTVEYSLNFETKEKINFPFEVGINFKF